MIFGNLWLSETVRGKITLKKSFILFTKKIPKSLKNPKESQKFPKNPKKSQKCQSRTRFDELFTLRLSWALMELLIINGNIPKEIV